MRAPSAFSNKRPLQITIARDQTKINVVTFSGSTFFFQPTQTVPVF